MSRKRGPAKPQGVTYAQVIAQQKAMERGFEQASRDAALKAEADEQNQRMLWMCVVAMHSAFRFGPKKIQEFLATLQEVADEVEHLRVGADDVYAYEKLRQRASKVSGIDIGYLYEGDPIYERLQHIKKEVSHEL